MIVVLSSLGPMIWRSRWLVFISCPTFCHSHLVATNARLLKWSSVRTIDVFSQFQSRVPCLCGNGPMKDRKSHRQSSSFKNLKLQSASNSAINQTNTKFKKLIPSWWLIWSVMLRRVVSYLRKNLSSKFKVVLSLLQQISKNQPKPVF